MEDQKNSKPLRVHRYNHTLYGMSKGCTSGDTVPLKGFFCSLSALSYGPTLIWYGRGFITSRRGVHLEFSTAKTKTKGRKDNRSEEIGTLDLFYSIFHKTVPPGPLNNHLKKCSIPRIYVCVFFVRIYAAWATYHLAVLKSATGRRILPLIFAAWIKSLRSIYNRKFNPTFGRIIPDTTAKCTGESEPVLRIRILSDPSLFRRIPIRIFTSDSDPVIYKYLFINIYRSVSKRHFNKIEFSS
jgi:hypothetical protein